MSSNTYKRSLFLLLLTLFFLPLKVVSQNYSFSHGGLTRSYIYYAPNNLPANAPLVFVLHGYSGSSADIRNYTGMNAVANANGFAVCYPQGIKDEWNNRFWNVGYDFHQPETIDDSDFLKSLAQYLQTQRNLNPDYTFVTGMSNGGDMSYMLACEQSDTFKAIAPVAGSMMKWIYDACPQNAVPVFKIHGDNDDTTLWEGDLDNSDGWGAYLPVMDTFNFWVQQNNCGSNTTANLPNTNTSDGSTVSSNKYASCTNNNQVWFYTVNNGGHDWPGGSGNMDINASEEIWNFFSAYIDNHTLSTRLNVAKKFRIFPNPSNEHIHIDVPSNYGEVNYKLFSVQGQMIQNGKLTKNSNNISILFLSNGLYILSIENQSFKILKE